MPGGIFIGMAELSWSVGTFLCLCFICCLTRFTRLNTAWVFLDIVLESLVRAENIPWGWAMTEKWWQYSLSWARRFAGSRDFPALPEEWPRVPQWHNLLFRVSRAPQSQPRAGSSHSEALEGTLHSEILMFKRFCLVWKNGFHYFLFAQGMWWTWSITTKASSKSWECFCSLETCYYFIPIGEILTLLFETSQNTAILTFGKHHYVKILHCMVKKINLSIFFKASKFEFYHLVTNLVC